MRRRLLQAVALSALTPSQALATTRAERADFAAVQPGVQLTFPHDHGAHPEFRIEWWYLTAWARAEIRPGHAEDIGLQITFFRINTGWQRSHRSRFAARELLFAHAALALPGQPRLIKAERAARTGTGQAEAAQGDTRLLLDRWLLERQSSDSYRAVIDDPRFGLSLMLRAERPPWLQGQSGWSQKGPRPIQASYYYSRPRLALEGTLELRDTSVLPRGGSLPSRRALRGLAWFDHEWSSALLDDAAEGWDWVGLHFDDGSSLMAFRIRAREGEPIWTDANWVDEHQRGLLTHDQARAVRFEPLRRWRSPRTGANWPVAMRVELAGRVLDLQPLLDDQELDTQASTGVTYWEGAVRVFESDRRVGEGYLELTGYAKALRI